jgi:4-amino-4-deoxy-L-arabinose transferase-like glycosyltransferase
MDIMAPLPTWLRDRPCLAALAWLVPAMLLPVLPIDETRYLSIAWEMRSTGDAIGLLLNGQPYMDKPPLLFWLVNVAWTLFGVSTVAARAVCVAFAAASIGTVVAVARRLGHDDAPAVGWVMLPFVLFGAFAPITMFDGPLVFFVALGFLGLVHWVQGDSRHGAALFLVAAVCGLLAKGPVFLVHVAGPLALVRWWHPGRVASPWRFAVGIGTCLVVACVPLAAWAVQSALRIDGVSVAHSLAHQSVGRVTHSFAHQRNVLWYVPWVVPFLLPWALVARWRQLRPSLGLASATPLGRFGIAASLPAFFVFSLISGKQVHYLLPLVPGAAFVVASMAREAPASLAYHRVGWLVAAAGLAWAWPVANATIGMRGNASWYVAALAAAAMLLVAAMLVAGMRHQPAGMALRQAAGAALAALVATVLLVGTHAKAHMDPAELADAVTRLQHRGVLVAAVDDEPGMVTFLARLAQPLPRITDEAAWVAAHPGGLALMHASRGSPPPFVVAPISLADGWEGLVPAAHLSEVRQFVNRTPSPAP